MYDKDFLGKACLHAFVSFLLDDGYSQELETGPPDKRWQKYMRELRDGMMIFRKADLRDVDMDDLNFGHAADAMWDSLRKLDNLHFEMGLRTGAALFADVPVLQLKTMLDILLRDGEEEGQ